MKNLLDSPSLIIDYYADWCDDCDEISPLYEKLSKQSKNIVFAKLNVDNLQFKDFCQSKSVVEIPTFHFFEKGVLKHVLRGSFQDQLEGSVKSMENGIAYPPNKLATATLDGVIIASSDNFRIANVLMMRLILGFGLFSL